MCGIAHVDMPKWVGIRARIRISVKRINVVGFSCYEDELMSSTARYGQVLDVKWLGIDLSGYRLRKELAEFRRINIAGGKHDFVRVQAVSVQVISIIDNVIGLRKNGP